MITFITYDQALMWNRFEKMFAISVAAIIATAILYIGLPAGQFQIGAMYLVGIVAQLIVLKCWFDISTMSKPFLNCWAFEE